MLSPKNDTHWGPGCVYSLDGGGGIVSQCIHISNHLDIDFKIFVNYNKI